MSRGRISQVAVLIGFVVFPWLAGQAPLAADKPADEKSPPAAARMKKRYAEQGNAERMQQQARQRGRRNRQELADSSRPDTRQVPAVTTGPQSNSAAPDPLSVAARVDETIAASLQTAGITPSARTNDEDFLRRVSLDIAGVPPTSREVTLFGLDPDPAKRERAIDRLLESKEYAVNWARYWRDVIYYRATETRQQYVRGSRQSFESWMTEQLQANKGWHEITTALLTATGDTSEAGQTGLIFAQRAEPDEVAAETSRIFLGIQLQCANCHDHPSDGWKREQFHGLAAFFPRLELRRTGDDGMRSFELTAMTPGEGDRRRQPFEQLKANPEQFIRRMDRDGDRKLSREEARDAPGGRQFERVFDFADADKDGKLTVAELKKFEPPPPMGRPRGSAEYYMPDLNNPQSQGTKFDPVFFLGKLSPGEGASDSERRNSLAKYISSPKNPWFARAFVNRIWAQLTGEGFYMPIDDLGPGRTASAPEALEALSEGFTASNYDIKWLFRAIANSQTYQRSIRSRDPKQTAASFAAAVPTRLRADQLYDALTHALGVKDLGRQQQERVRGMPGMGDGTGRGSINQIYGFDPSTAPDELLGTLPQALFFMNSSLVNSMIRGVGETRLAQILEKFPDNDDAIKELYLQVHARDPSEREMQICRDYVRQVSNRREAFEDLQWTLLNSTEFLTKR